MFDWGSMGDASTGGSSDDAPAWCVLEKALRNCKSLTKLYKRRSRVRVDTARGRQEHKQE